MSLGVLFCCGFTSIITNFTLHYKLHYADKDDPDDTALLTAQEAPTG